MVALVWSDYHVLYHRIITNTAIDSDIALMSSLISSQGLPVERWLKFMSTQAGRDKLYRFIQYFSRFLAYHLRKGNPKSDLGLRIHHLSVSVGLARKLFRMGKPLDFLQSALKSFAIEDEVIKYATIAKCTGYGSWLILDMLQWLQNNKVIQLNQDLMTSINKNAPRLWLFGILSNLTINLQKIQKNFNSRQLHEKLRKEGAPSVMNAMVLDREMRSACQGAIQDMIDLLIPLSILGWLNLSPGTIGLAGSITSIMGASNIYPEK